MSPLQAWRPARCDSRCRHRRYECRRAAARPHRASWALTQQLSTRSCSLLFGSLKPSSRLRSHPFPKLEAFRGQCAVLGHALRAKGIKIYRHGAARVSHPPPEGFSHFANRAICHGHDMMMIGNLKNHSWFRASPLGSVWRLLRDLMKVPGRVSNRYRQAGLGPMGWIGAFTLAVSYYWLKFVGDLLAFFMPRTVRKVFSI
jgi:hypothetical protein